MTTPTPATDKYRYQVTVNPNVSIGPREYVDIVVLSTLTPGIAIGRALNRIARRDPDNQLWQSDKLVVTVERVR